MTSWTSVTVGVASLDEALDLWVGTFGLEIMAMKEGEDAELSRLCEARLTISARFHSMVAGGLLEMS